MEDRDFDLCMERMKKGDKSALKDVYEAYAGFIFHLIIGILQNRENAEDVTSEFFIKLWSIADSYVPGSGHRTYLGRIAHNMAIDYLRAHKREIPVDLTGSEGDGGNDVDSANNAGLTGSGGAPPGQISGADETADAVISDISLKEMLGLLKPAEREVVHLKIVGQMTFEEIARILNQPMGTVTWRYREAIKKLRRCGFDA